MSVCPVYQVSERVLMYKGAMFLYVKCSLMLYSVKSYYFTYMPNMYMPKYLFQSYQFISIISTAYVAH